MSFNYLTHYNLMQILVEEGLHAVKTDKKTLQEFSNKFINITDEIQNAAKDIKIEDGESANSDVTLLSNFYDFRNNISKLDAKYISDKNINNITNEISNNLNILTKKYSKIIEDIKKTSSIEDLKKLFSNILEFNKYLKQDILGNPNINNNFYNDLLLILKKWENQINDYFKLKEKSFNSSQDPQIYINFKNGNGFISNDYKESKDCYFFHEGLLYNLTIRKQISKYKNENIWNITFSADEYNGSFSEFIQIYDSLSLQFKARNLKDTQTFWNKIITIIKYYAETESSNMKYFKFKGSDNIGKKISSAISENKALKIFELFNEFLFANADIEAQIPAQQLIRWMQQYYQDWKYGLKLKIKELKQKFFEFENPGVVNRKIKSIDTLAYLKIIKMIKNNKQSFEEEEKTLINFFKKYNNIKKKLNDLDIDNLKPNELFKILSDLNEDITAILSLEGKIKVALKNIESFIDNLPTNQKNEKLIKQYNLITLNSGRFIRVVYSTLFIQSLNEIKNKLILTLGYSLIRYAINKERINISKKTNTNKKQIYFKKSVIIKKINSIIFNLIEYFKIVSLNQELKNNFNSIFNFIESLSPATKSISKEEFKTILIKTINNINKKYKFTIKHSDFEKRLKLYMSNFQDNKRINIFKLKESKDFDFSPFQIEAIIKGEPKIVQPGSLLELTKTGKLAIMNARDKRYYKLLISYGIKDENIVFDSDKEIVFSAI